MGLYYSKESKSQLIGYADARYLSNPHKTQSQIRYAFTCRNVAISWRSVKQTMIITFSNHLEILAIYEVSREYVWLRSMIKHIQVSCELSSIKDTPTMLHEDNVACIAQIKGGCIKGDQTKLVSLKFFCTHDFKRRGKSMFNK